ncbi:MAG: lysyl oxidase family protein, partial [Gaiellales bacterium]
PPPHESGDVPLAPTFPTWCGVNPFAVGIPWGIDQGWGVNPFPAAAVKLPDGTYTFTVSIASPYRELFGISAADDSTTLRVTVATAPATPVTGRRPAQAPRSFGPVPTTTNPPNRARPDLIPLPAWSIGVQRQSGRDLLGFGATIWVGGNGPLEVEGYRQPNSNVMSAFQYFLDGTRVVGRAPAGTFQWDSRPGHNHWHFEQFANYSLIDPATGTSVRSMKQSFCIAPTDALDLLLPHASMDGSGLWSQCGDPAAIWIREALPVGWGDTYFQSVAGQAFDITNIPNGTYQIAVTANPERLLYESNTGNDTSIRQVTLGGTPGHRTVTVAPWHGIMA